MKSNKYMVYNEENLNKNYKEDVSKKERQPIYNQYGVEVSRTRAFIKFSNVKYIGSKKTKILHDKSCYCVEMVGSKHVRYAESFYTGEKKRYCKLCFRKAICRSEISDFHNYETYKKLFDRNNVSTELLYKLFVECGARAVLEKYFIRITCNEDTWKISRKSQDGEFVLCHNNYRKNYFGERFITNGYHTQNINDNTLVGILEYIINYDYNELHNPQKHFIGNIKKLATREFERMLEEFSQARI